MSYEFEPSKDAQTWATLSHAAGLAAYTGIPFAGIVAVLVIWLLKREQHPFVEEQGRESLNFQITIGIYSLVCFLLAFILIGFFLLFALAAFHVVFTILAIINCSKGRSYRYPMTIRLV